MTEVNHKIPEQRAAEAALREAGWEPWEPDEPNERELAAGLLEGDVNGVEAVVWRGNEPDTVLYATKWAPDSSEPALWTRQLPRPEEVPPLLKRYAGLLTPAGTRGYVLDLTTGEITRWRGRLGKKTARTAIEAAIELQRAGWGIAPFGLDGAFEPEAITATAPEHSVGAGTVITWYKADRDKMFGAVGMESEPLPAFYLVWDASMDRNPDGRHADIVGRCPTPEETPAVVAVHGLRDTVGVPLADRFAELD